MAQSGRTEPLTNTERLIVQNIFDTQPKKREAYLKRLGFQMNPRDENEYRPIGSDQPYGEIDPGVSAYFKKGALAEMGKDIGDIGVDMLASGPAATIGAAGGALMGTPLGPIAMLLGGVSGGTAGNYIAEEAKNAAANLLLDEEIPMDRGAALTQSLLVGAAPLVMKGVLQGGKAAWKKALELRISAIKKGIGSGLTNEMVDVMMQDPEKYTPNAVKNANKELLGTIKKIFGTDDPFNIKAPDQIKEGIFRDKIQPLNEQAEKLINEANQDPSKSWTLKELNDYFKSTIDRWKNGQKEFNLDEDTKRAITFLQNKKSEISQELSKLNPGLAPEQIELPFGEIYKLGKIIQKDAWDLHPNAPGSNLLRSFTGGDPEGLTKQLDLQLPDLAKVNAQRKKIMDAYEFAAKRINEKNVGTFFTGRDNAAKEAVKEGLSEIDNVLGTNLSKEVETGGVQSFVKDIYERNIDGGSKNLRALQVTEGIQEGVKGAMGGAALGYTVGAAPVGAVAGGLAGITKGVNQAAKFADPEFALKELLKARSEAAMINPKSVGLPGATAITAGTGVGAAMVSGRNDAANLPEVQPQMESEPWPDIDAPANPAPSPSPSASQSPEPWPEI